VRPVIAFVIFASGLKYIGVATTTLGWILCATLLLCGVAWLIVSRPWTSFPRAASAPPGQPAPMELESDPREAAPVGRD
jgi:hypothetical protein